MLSQIIIVLTAKTISSAIQSYFPIGIKKLDVHQRSLIEDALLNNPRKKDRLNYFIFRLFFKLNWVDIFVFVVVFLLAKSIGYNW